MRSTVNMNLEYELPQRKRAASPKQTNNDEGRPPYLQIRAATTSARCQRSLVRRQKIPDGRVFRPENPGAESLQAAVFHQRTALAEGVRVGEKNPFAQVVAIKEKPGRTVYRIPLHAPCINPGEFQCVVGGDVLGTWVGLVR